MRLKKYFSWLAVIIALVVFLPRSASADFVPMRTLFFRAIPYLIAGFIAALLITIIIELLVSWIFISVKRLPKKIFVYVIIANIISWPIVLVFCLLDPSITGIVMAEIFAVLFEAYFVYRKHIVSFKQSLILSILNNFASFFIGYIIYYALAYFTKHYS